MKKFKFRKIQYSKILPIVSLMLFAVCLYEGFHADFSTIVDVSFYVTAITISGSLTATSFIFYLRKAQQENCVTLKTEMYRVASSERIKYNEKMMALKKKYEIDDEDISDIEIGSMMDEFEQDALESINNTINQAQMEADTMIEKETF